MVREADVVVIGAGPGGYVAAIRLGQLGKKPILVDRDRLGGVCLNYGCIPSKALIHAADIVHEARSSDEKGIRSEVKVDFGEMQGWKNRVVNTLRQGIEKLCRSNGVEVMKGEARFLSSEEVMVIREDAEERVRAKNFIIATGSRHIDLRGFEYDGQTIISSKEALDLDHIPKSMLIVGGGITGLEIGTAYRKLGTEVYVVELLEQLIPGLDPDLVRILSRSLKKLGIEFHVRSKVTALEMVPGGAKVTAETPEGERLFEVEKVFVTVGRRPNVENLGLEDAGVKLNKEGFIDVNEKLQTTVPNIYAIGDCIGIPFLAHKASREGIIAAEVIAGLPRKIDYTVLPAAIYTDPEIATVGLSEEEAREKGHDIKVGRFPFSASGRALTSDKAEGFVKIIADAETDRVLGVRIVGPKASEIISEAALAIEMGATLEDLARTVHPHPTLPETIMEAAEALLGKAIHIVNR